MNADEQRWLATLAGGAVVLVAVGGLLELLRRSVDEVDGAVDRVWASGKLLAQNTQVAHLLTGTGRGVRAVARGLGVPTATPRSDDAERAATT